MVHDVHVKTTRANPAPSECSTCIGSTATSSPTTPSEGAPDLMKVLMDLEHSGCLSRSHAGTAPALLPPFPKVVENEVALPDASGLSSPREVLQKEVPRIDVAAPSSPQQCSLLERPMEPVSHAAPLPPAFPIPLAFPQEFLQHTPHPVEDWARPPPRGDHHEEVVKVTSVPHAAVPVELTSVPHAVGIPAGGYHAPSPYHKVVRVVHASVPQAAGAAGSVPHPASVHHKVVKQVVSIPRPQAGGAHHEVVKVIASVPHPAPVPHDSVGSPRSPHRASGDAHAAPMDTQKKKYDLTQHLEYLSSSQGCWVDCEVTRIRPEDGAVQVNVRPGYWFRGAELTEKLRLPERVLAAGKELEYYSSSHKTWVPCKVVASRAEDGAVQINVKPGVWLSETERKSLLRDPSTQNVLRIPARHEVFELGQDLEFFSIRKDGWVPCKVVAKRQGDGAIEVDWKPGHWMSPSEQQAKLRDPKDANRGSPRRRITKDGRSASNVASAAAEGALLGGNPAEEEDSEQEDSAEARYELIEKPGLLYDEDQQKGKVASVEEAERLVLANPGKYAGYSWQVNGSLVVVRKVGTKLCPTLSCFKSKTLAAKSVVYEGELYEDPYCGHSGTSHQESPFPGGLENGKGKQNPWALWKRPGRGEGLYDRLGVKLFGSISPNDIEQGSVGDCWLLASIAALAEFSPMVRKLFNGRSSLSLRGRYSISLWSWKRRSWRTIDIDDRLAVKGDHAMDPAFAKITSDGELWPALLEKATAVLCGGFDFIDGNQPTFALGMLTGSDQVYHFKRTNPGHPGGKWTGYREEFTEDCCPTYMSKFDGSYMKNDRANGKIYAYTHSDGAWPGGRDGEEPRADAEMWAALRRWDAKNYVMLCDTCGFGGQKTDQHTFPCGLPYSHAYSLIRVETNVAGTGINLVQIRNPHGTNEPNLKWKDGDAAWERHPKVKAALRPEFMDDGSFWISDEDFFKHFGNVFVLKCPMDKPRSGQKDQTVYLTPKMG